MQYLEVYIESDRELITMVSQVRMLQFKLVIASTR